MEIFSWIFVGLIANWLAGLILKDGGFGPIGDIIVGVVSGLLGGWIATTFLHIGPGMTGISLVSILVVFAGAVLLLLGLGLLSRRSRHTIFRKEQDTASVDWKRSKGRLSWK